MLFANSYFARASSTGNEGYVESERIFNEAADSVFASMSTLLSAAEKTELAWKISLLKEDRGGNMKEIYLDIYFLMSDQEYYEYVVEPIAAEYARITLQRIRELGIDVDKR